MSETTLVVRVKKAIENYQKMILSFLVSKGEVRKGNGCRICRAEEDV